MTVRSTLARHSSRFAPARELYADDFVDHVNALEFRGQEGIAKSVAMYRAIFPDLRIDAVAPARPAAGLALAARHAARRSGA